MSQGDQVPEVLPPTPVQDCPLELEQARKVVLDLVQELLAKVEQPDLQTGSLRSADYGLQGQTPEGQTIRVPIIRVALVLGATAVHMYTRCMVGALASMDEMAALQSREEVAGTQRKVVVN